MIEAAITGGAAAVAGMAALLQRVHNRITELDQRMDRFELYSAKNYINRTEYSEELGKLEAHMIRIEHKIDQFMQTLARRQAPD